MKKNHTVLFLALLGIALLIGLLLITSHQTAPKVANPTPTASSDGSHCDASLQQHVYHPDRLKVITPCLTVTGTIRKITPEADGDDHIRLELDPEFTHLLNAKNISVQHGDLVIEPICLHMVTQADAIDACIGAHDSIFVPRVGTHVTVTGVYVVDHQHGWNELHPVSSITIS